MYTLLNVIKFGLKQTLTIGEADAKVLKKNDLMIDDIGRMDFLSGFYFRVFENFNVGENDPARFKLDIRVNRGSILDDDKVHEIENHTIPIKIDNSFHKSLTLEDIDFFFNTLLDMSVSTRDHEKKDDKDKKKKDKKKDKEKDGKDKDKTADA